LLLDWFAARRQRFQSRLNRRPCLEVRGDDTVFDPRTVGGGRTTYGAITAGLTIKPMVPAPLTGLMIRPELRYDWSLNGTHPFNDSPDQDMFTAAVDFVVMF
jgi:hypothetical protein